MPQRRRNLEEYRGFPNLPIKNAVYVSLEGPAAVRALRLQPGMRVLELGCRRGFALACLRVW